MNPFRLILTNADAPSTLPAQVARRAVRRPLACENLEGRQLLNGSWGSGWLTQNAAASATPADVASTTGTTTTATSTTTHAHAALAGHRGGLRGGFQGHGHGPGGNATPPTITAAAKADLAALQTDTKALQAEVPSDLQATITADQAVVKKALDSLAPGPRRADRAGLQSSTTTTTTPSATDPGPGPDGFDLGFPGQGLPGLRGPLGNPADADPTANLAAMLEKTGISTTQADQIVADFQSYQTTLKALDPTLQSKIAADQAALAKDMPAMPSRHGFPGDPAATSTTSTSTSTTTTGTTTA